MAQHTSDPTARATVPDKPTTAYVVGADIPLALVEACGFVAQRVSSQDFASWDERPDGVTVVSALSASNTWRYHRFIAEGSGPPIVFVDLPLADEGASRRYAARRYREAGQRLADIAGVVLDPHRLTSLLCTEWQSEIDAARTFAAPGDGAPAVLGSSNRACTREELAAMGWNVVAVEGEHGYGSNFSIPAIAEDDPWTAMAEVHATRAATANRGSMSGRAQALLTLARTAGAEAILLGESDRSEASTWFAAILRRLAGSHVRVEVIDAPAAPATRAPKTHGGAERPRVRKVLSVADGFGAYQREWFADVRRRVAEGAPFAMVNADAPQEILRALDIPFVVSQWWAAIAAAKGGTARSREALRAAGLPPASASYLSQGLASNLDDGPDAPWGGLPTPDILEYVYTDDVVAGIFEEWADRTGAHLVPFERTAESRAEFPVDWWNRLAHDWDSTIEEARVDLMTEQLRRSIGDLEEITGRRLDEAELRRVLDLVNEQEEWYRRTRDLIATARPTPVGVVDTIPATMIPQWHRGTEWGRDAAKRFYEEVRERVDNGSAVCPDERIRLMWAGVGLWQHMWLYQAFEESHGAVFVWSIYLGLAADGYARYAREGSDPLRAMAARYVTMGDELRMPLWSGEWYVSEARKHAVDAVVSLGNVEPAIIARLRDAGIAVLVLDIDNLTETVDQAHAEISAFLDHLTESRANGRDEGESA